VVYRALAEHPVRIPGLIAEAPDGRTLLMERALGTEDFGSLPRSVEEDFGGALAELHAIDPNDLELGDMARPAVPADHALLDLNRWAGFQQARVERRSEISRFSIDWLGEHAPAEVDRTALCHGDAGVGNFLHDGTRVTALLDWEFAHLGDPLDDVAWVLVRSHVTGGAPLRAGLGRWSEQSGLPLDAQRIAYYQALVLLRMAISCEIALSNRSKSATMNTATYEILLPYLAYLLPQALREAGCRGSRLDALDEEANAAVREHPVLKAAARPRVPWKES
jgi:aminoglycoside phosphotransferase (APT) family kinase protein